MSGLFGPSDYDIQGLHNNIDETRRKLIGPDDKKKATPERPLLDQITAPLKDIQKRLESLVNSDRPILADATLQASFNKLAENLAASVKAMEDTVKGHIEQFRDAEKSYKEAAEKYRNATKEYVEAGMKAIADSAPVPDDNVDLKTLKTLEHYRDHLSEWHNSLSEAIVSYADRHAEVLQQSLATFEKECSDLEKRRSELSEKEMMLLEKEKRIEQGYTAETAKREADLKVREAEVKQVTEKQEDRRRELEEREAKLRQQEIDVQKGLVGEKAALLQEVKDFQARSINEIREAEKTYCSQIQTWQQESHEAILELRKKQQEQMEAELAEARRDWDTLRDKERSELDHREKVLAEREMALSNLDLQLKASSRELEETRALFQSEKESLLASLQSRSELRYEFMKKERDAACETARTLQEEKDKLQLLYDAAKLSIARIDKYSGEEFLRMYNELIDENIRLTRQNESLKKQLEKSGN